MGIVQNKHTLKRKKAKKPKPCGTYVEPPPNDVWYQCDKCY
jgi:hypothetical protein